MNGIMFLLIGFIIIFVVVYRKNNGENVYKYVVKQTSIIYEKYAPY